MLVTVPAADVERLTALAERHGVPVTDARRAPAATRLSVDGSFDVDLALLRDTWTRTLPDALG